MAKPLVSQGLVDKRLLSIQRFNTTARRQFVLSVEFGVNNFRVQFGYGKKPGWQLPVLGVFWLAQHELTRVCVIADIEPIVAILIGASRDDLPARLARVHAPNENVGLAASAFVQEFGHPFPGERRFQY